MGVIRTRNHPKHFRKNIPFLMKWFCVVQVVFAIAIIPLSAVLFDKVFLLTLPNTVVFGVLYYFIVSRYDSRYKSLGNEEFSL